MNTTIEQLVDNFNTIPFLFAGSGITRRYYNLPDWKGLLNIMAGKISADPFIFRYYEDKATHMDNNLYVINPKIATLLEKDFNSAWFNDKKMQSMNKNITKLVLNGCSPFKAEICSILKDASNMIPEYREEVTLLNNVAKKSIAGIITTNYDLFFEKYISEYKVYVGQQQLLFSQLQGIAEVYKIHGSLNDPQSIVITEEDYKIFKESKEYLAAKLLTIFMEYPIIFIGYSISDQNIMDILESIVKCISEDEIDKLRNKFIFVEYVRNYDGYRISDHSFKFENGKILTMTKITLSDYSILYKALLNKKMRIPVRLLRMLKDELYLYTLTNNPTQNIKVAEIDDERISNDDLVISIGTKESFNLKGLEGISTDQWYRNIVLNDLNYEVKDLLAYAPRLASQESGVLPINSLFDKKYANIEGITSLIKESYDELLSNTIKKQRDKYDFKSLEDIKKMNYSLDKELLYIVFKGRIRKCRRIRKIFKI